MHGVGFWEEKPIVSQPNQWSEGSFDYVLEPATPPGTYLTLFLWKGCHA